MKVFNIVLAADIPLKNGIPLPFNLDQTNGTFILMLICFLFFAYIYKGSFSLLKENITLLFSFRKDHQALRNFTTRDAWYTYYLTAQFAILVSISIYDIFTEYGTNRFTEHQPFRTIVFFILLIFVFLLLKFFIYKCIGYIYSKKNEMAVFLYSQTIIIEILGILFFIPTLFLLYADYLHTEIAIFMLILFIVSQLILFYRMIVYFIREKFSFLFMIAYLCTIEIVPYIFLAAGLILLYKTDELTVLW